MGASITVMLQKHDRVVLRLLNSNIRRDTDRCHAQNLQCTWSLDLTNSKRLEAMNKKRAAPPNEQPVAVWAWVWVYNSCVCELKHYLHTCAVFFSVNTFACV